MANDYFQPIDYLANYNRGTDLQAQAKIAYANQQGQMQQELMQSQVAQQRIEEQNRHNLAAEAMNAEKTRVYNAIQGAKNVTANRKITLMDAYNRGMLTEQQLRTELIAQGQELTWDINEVNDKTKRRGQDIGVTEGDKNRANRLAGNQILAGAGIGKIGYNAGLKDLAAQKERWNMLAAYGDEDVKAQAKTELDRIAAEESNLSKGALEFANPQSSANNQIPAVTDWNDDKQISALDNFLKAQYPDPMKRAKIIKAMAE